MAQELAVRDQVALDRPAAAAGDHLRQREAGGQIRRVDPSGTNETSRNGAQSARRKTTPPVALGREELEHVEAIRTRELDFGRGAGANCCERSRAASVRTVISTQVRPAAVSASTSGTAAPAEGSSTTGTMLTSLGRATGWSEGAVASASVNSRFRYGSRSGS